MSPHLAPLIEQLETDGVAFENPHAVDPQVADDVTRASHELSGNALPELGVVVLDHSALGGAGLRDVAQDLNIATGIDTVIVRSPDHAIAVSDTLSRAEIEVAQLSMVAEPNYAQGLREFAATANGLTIPWGVVSVVAVILAVTVIAGTAFFTRRGSLK